MLLVRKVSIRTGFIKNRKGVAALELALFLPFMLIVFFGIIEVSRYVLMNQKVDNAVHSVADLVNRNLTLDKKFLKDIVQAFPTFIEPYKSNEYNVIISAITVDENTTESIIKWSYRGGNGSNKTRIYDRQNKKVLIPELQLQKREQVICVEVFLRYKPIIGDNIYSAVVADEVLAVYKKYVSRPRYGSFQFDPL